MVKQNFRFAFTFIELIFAIVIIGISVISLPTITQVLNTGLEKNMAQEALLLGSSDVLRAISGQWDENSREGNNSFEYTLYATNTELALMNGNPGRFGYINILYHRNDTLRPSMNIDLDALGRKDDVDDYSTTGLSVDAVDDVGSAENFKDLYKKVISITQNEIFAGVNYGLNIKKLTVKIQKSDYSDLSQLYIYVFNTGNASSPSRQL